MADDNKLFVYGLIFGAVLLFCLSLASASKTYNEETQTYEMKDFIFLKRYDISLNYYNDSVINAWAGGDLVVHKETKVFKKLFYKNKGGYAFDFIEEKGEGYKIYLNNSYMSYKYIPNSNCENIENDLGNGTILITENCTEILGDWIEDGIKINWIEINYTEKIPIGNYLWKVDAQKPLNQVIDFIIETDDEGTLDKWAWWNSSFNYKREIQINSTVGTTLTNFPAVITIDTASLISAGKMQADCDDIRVLNSAESVEYSYEIEDNSCNTAYTNIYFKLSSMSDDSANTTAYLYYDSSGVSSGENVAGVWSNGYVHVSHMTGLTDEVGGVTWTNNNGVSFTTIDNKMVGNFTGSSSQYLSITGTANYLWTTNTVVSLHVKPIINSSAMFGTLGFLTGSEGWSFEGGSGTNFASNWGFTTQAEIWETDNLDINTIKYFNVKREDTNGTFFDGGVLKETNIWALTDLEGRVIGKRPTAGGTPFLHGYVDEIRWANVVRSDDWLRAEMSQLASLGAEESNLQNPDINIIEPANNYKSNVSNLFFNCSCSDDTGCYTLNMTIDSIQVAETTGAGNTNLTLSYTNNSIPDGNYTWYCSGNDGTTEVNSSIVSFIVDTTNPILTFYAPLTNSTTRENVINVTLNFTATDQNLDSTSCYYNITTPVYFTCNTLVNMTFLTNGLITVGYGANDTTNNKANGSFNHFIYFYNYSISYTGTVLEGESNIIYFYLNSTEIDNATTTVNLTYDGAIYNSDLIYNNGTVALYTNTFQIPAGQNTTEQKLFNFSIELNSIISQSDNFNQTVTFLTELNITRDNCSDKALKFTLVDEVNATNLTGDIYYNFKYGTQNNSLKSKYGYINETESFYLCVNGSLNRDYVIGYGEIQYTTNNHVDRRFYVFTNATINNNSYEEKDLRNLGTSISVTFENTFQDTSLNFYDNKYMGLWRWYPGEDAYLLVEMAKTDEDGEAISHLVTEDVDYRVGLYHINGTLIKLSAPKRFVCASSPCSFTLTVDADETDYTSIFDVETSLNYNTTTMVFTMVYNDPNQLSSSLRLLVTREQGDNSLVICDTSSAEFSGVLTCDTSLYTTGIKKAVVYRSASPPVIVNQKLVQDGTTALRNNLGLIFSLILFLAILFTGMVSPVWTIILAIIGLIPAFAFGSINIAIFTGLAVLGAIIIHFIKRAVAR